MIDCKINDTTQSPVIIMSWVFGSSSSLACFMSNYIALCMSPICYLSHNKYMENPPVFPSVAAQKQTDFWCVLTQ